MKTIVLLLAAALSSLSTAMNAAFAQSWTQTGAPITNWSSVASSADGSKLVAGIEGGGIYSSSDGGVTWTPSGASIAHWTSVASSADGSKLAAVAPGSGIYLSTNCGATWDLSSAPETSDSVASSADGNRLVAGPSLYISTDAGATWTPSSSFGPMWSPVACSADGNTVIGLHFYGEIDVSTNAGATWTVTNPNNGWWTSAALSADGRRIVVACIRRRFQSFFLPGEILISTNYGATWNTTSAPANSWSSVASSADGTQLVAAGGGLIYTSMDAGVTWSSNSTPVTNWSSVACSADGGKWVAVVHGGGIGTARSTVAPLLSITSSSSDLVLSWTIPSTSFVLQQDSDLNAIDWTDLGETPTLNFTNLQYQATVPRSAGNRFYRLKH